MSPGAVKLSRCAWKVLCVYLKQGVPYEDGTPGAAIAVQTFGEFQRFNPHLHIIATDGCFYGEGFFMRGPKPCAKDLEEAFRYEVFTMLKKEGRINDQVIDSMLSWRHSGFNVYCGNAIWPHNQEGLENLARYIIRASFSQERMVYIPLEEAPQGRAQVIYFSKSGDASQTFDALDWLAQLVTHIPDKGEQMVRYYGYYSNKSRGLRKKGETDDMIPALSASDVSPKEFRKNWARMIQKVYNVDPLVCPKCQGSMRIISFIEDSEIVEKILRHLGLWETRNHDPPAARVTYEAELVYDDEYSQIPPYDDWLD